MDGTFSVSIHRQFACAISASGELYRYKAINKTCMKRKLRSGARARVEVFIAAADKDDEGVVRTQIPAATNPSKIQGCVSQVTSLDPNQTYLDVVWPRT